jgi:hypothetical protein
MNPGSSTCLRWAIVLIPAAFALGSLSTASAHEDAASASHGAVVSGSPGGAASSDGSGESHTRPPGQERKQTVAHYRLDTADLANETASSGRLAARGTSGEPMVLKLEEFDLFLPGERKVVYRHEDGSKTEVPYLGRTFKGSLAGDPASQASILIAPEGLYGSVSSHDRLWSFQRSTEQDPTNGPTEVTQEVIGYEAPPPDPSALLDSPLGASPTEPTPRSASIGLPFKVIAGGGTGGSAGTSGGYTYAVAPYADPAYVSYASDWSNRIVAALGQGVNMWSSETQVSLATYAPTAAEYNFAAFGSCQSGDNDGGLESFRQFVDTAAVKYRGPNAYGLFEAHADMGLGIGGCARFSHLDSNYRHATGTYTHDYDAAFVINAKDWRDIDTWNPGSSHDLGVGTNHEMTHLAGETNHPTDGTDCDFNLMNNEVYYWCKNEWRTYWTIDAVRSFAYPYM